MIRRVSDWAWPEIEASSSGIASSLVSPVSSSQNCDCFPSRSLSLTYTHATLLFQAPNTSFEGRGWSQKSVLKRGNGSELMSLENSLPISHYCTDLLKMAQSSALGETGARASLCSWEALRRKVANAFLP